MLMQLQTYEQKHVIEAFAMSTFSECVADKCKGVLFGAAIGDAIGAIYLSQLHNSSLSNRVGLVVLCYRLINRIHDNS